MSRTKQIQTRPELPGLEEILSDLQSAPDNDVAFTFLRNCAGDAKSKDFLQVGTLLENRAATSTTMSSSSIGDGSSRQTRDTKMYESAAKRPRQEPSRATGSRQQHLEDEGRPNMEDGSIQDCYMKVLKFLEMNAYLKDSQEKLSKQSSDLQDVGQAVKDQIDSLRTQLHS